MLSDGYAAYERYAENQADVTHAQCWSHSRRYFERALNAEPESAGEALSLIGTLYRHEEIIRDTSLSGEKKLAYRTKHSEPIVRSFWQWCDQQCQRSDFLPKNPLTTALKYVMKRQASLQVFLSDPDLSIDTNIQSLLVTCQLQDVDSYSYLVDVLQRVNEQPASKVNELTPRVWKQTFADNPLRSDLARFN